MSDGMVYMNAGSGSKLGTESAPLRPGSIHNRQQHGPTSKLIPVRLDKTQAGPNSEFAECNSLCESPTVIFLPREDIPRFTLPAISAQRR